MQGVTMIKHGSRPDWIVPGQVDRGGTAGALTSPDWTSKNVPGQVLTGFLVQVEKVTGNEMDEWRKNPRSVCEGVRPGVRIALEPGLKVKVIMRINGANESIYDDVGKCCGCYVHQIAWG
jgi:hypothetical protein